MYILKGYIEMAKLIEELHKDAIKSLKKHGFSQHKSEEQGHYRHPGGALFMHSPGSNRLGVYLDRNGRNHLISNHEHLITTLKDDFSRDK